ncbi:MAG: hypothetical protein PHT51_05465 [Patescibacteria group bacterium]|nr:hypothetical protein [Patescibacteria group bacterium]MDD4611158.1 hypothetical protein [Patescibacteria group bacterium]
MFGKNTLVKREGAMDKLGTKEFYLNFLLKRDKKVRRHAEDVLKFHDIPKCFAFLSAVAEAGIKGNQRNHDFAKKFVLLARKRFAELPIRQMFGVLKQYYLPVLYPKKYSKPQSFAATEVLGGSSLGDYEQAKKIMSATVALLEQNRFPETREQLENFSVVYSFFLGIITVSGITHTWRNIIEGSVLNLPGMRGLLKRSLGVFYVYGAEMVCYIAEENWNPEKDSSFSVPIMAIQQIKIGESRVYLPVPRRLLQFMQELRSEVTKELEETQEELLKLAAWFRLNLDELAMHFQKMWEEICGPGCRYAIRCGGIDRVTLEIPGLREAGYKSLQFLCEDTVFPEVRARYHAYGFYGCYNITLRLTNKSLRDYGNKGAGETDPCFIVDLILAYVALHCYWQIVCGVRKGDKATGAGDGKPGVKNGGHHIVRPHLRCLPPNWKASSDAKAEATNVFGKGFQLPSGYTLVREYERGDVHTHCNNLPLFSYHERDLGCVIS